MGSNNKSKAWWLKNFKLMSSKHILFFKMLIHLTSFKKKILMIKKKKLLMSLPWNGSTMYNPVWKLKADDDNDVTSKYYKLFSYDKNNYKQVL